MANSPYHRRTPPAAYDPGWLNAEFAAIERNVGTYLSLSGGTVDGTLTVTGTATFTEGVNVTGTLAVTANSSFANNLTVNGALAVGQQTVLNNTLSVVGAYATTLGGALQHNGSTVGFFGSTPAAKPTVTGSRGGNAALASLITALSTLGLITDSSTT